MLTYAARRLTIAVPVLIGILFISFVFVQLLPGDPIRALLSPEEAAASPEYIARRRDELGLDESLLIQFVTWVREALQGNLGYSFHQRVAVTELIAERIGPTILLVTAGVSVALLIGVLVGVLAALKQNSLFDYASAVGSMITISIPNFFLGLVAIYVFSLWLGILPTGGMRTLAAPDTSLWDSIRHMVLPVGVLAATLVGPYVRLTRQSMLDVLRQDFVTTARAKGVPRRGVVVRHGLRNALVPLVTVLAIQIPELLGGVLIIEMIFSWPGLGRLAFDSVIGRDYPVIIALALTSALLVLAFNLLADLVTAALDPRIRL